MSSRNTHSERDLPAGDAKTVTCWDNTLRFLRSSRFLIYICHALSTWGDRMWHFAVALFLVELYGNSLLLTAAYGLVVAFSVLICGALIGHWVDTNSRIKVAQTSLVIQNSSVIFCGIVLMMIFMYRNDISNIWDGWLIVFCYVVVIGTANVANLASTATTITIQRDWVVVLAEGHSGRLADMNAILRRIDQVSNVLAPLAVGQLVSLASSSVACAFVAVWNLGSMAVEYWLLRRVYLAVPALAHKGGAEWPPASALEMQPLGADVTGQTPPPEAKSLIGKGTEEEPPAPTSRWLRVTEPFRTLWRGWVTYRRQPVYLAGVGLACLYMTVLGFDCITTGYAYTQGISASLLGILITLSAVAGLLGTVVFTQLRRAVGLVRTGLLSGVAQLAALSLCAVSVFAPGSPLDLSISPFRSLGMTGDSTDAPVQHNQSEFVASTMSSSVAPNATWDDEPDFAPPDSYVSVALLLTGVIAARIGLWSFDLTVTQLVQETVAEHERGVVSGVQNSLNYLLDLLHFTAVLLAPEPPAFGLLVLLSVAFVVMGHALFLAYAHGTLGPRICSLPRRQSPDGGQGSGDGAGRSSCSSSSAMDIGCDGVKEDGATANSGGVGGEVRSSVNSV
ncbi:unnamed protein product [Lampetra planeri]